MATKFFNKEKYNGAAIHCTTKDQWDKVSQIAGIEWFSAKWEEDKENSGINVSGGRRGNIVWYRSQGYTIVEAEDFIKDHIDNYVNNSYEIF